MICIELSGAASLVCIVSSVRAAGMRVVGVLARLVAASLVVMGLAVFGSTSALAGQRPNLLFILVDDQSPEDFTFYNPKSTLDSP